MSRRLIQIRVKRLLDCCVAILLLVVLLPLLLVIAACVWSADRGPAIFRQTRVGMNSSHFTLLKFRTMVVNADQCVNRHGRVTAPNRVTWMGQWLRKTGLDELPQLINIIRGEMSFVGPRPMLVDHFNKLPATAKQRSRMRPGVTGLAQVNGRNKLRWSRRIELDRAYVEQFNLWLDAKIVLRTLRVVVLQEGFQLDRNPDAVDDCGLNDSIDSTDHPRNAA